VLAHRLRRKAAGAGNEAAGVTSVHVADSAAVNNNTWTLNGVAYGDAPGGASSRTLIVIVTATDNDTSDTTDVTVSATLGGSTVDQRNINMGAGASGTGICWIGTIDMPSGTSGQLIVTVSGFSGTMDEYGLSVLRAINLSSAVPTTTPTGTTDITLVVPANGFGAVVAAHNDGFTLGAWSGADIIPLHVGEGTAAYRTVSGSVVHDSALAQIFAGATWTFV
jgi:hypothetical protein